MNGRKRTIQVKFYVTEEERALIEQKMKLVPTLNIAAYLRKIAIDGYIIQVDHADIRAMTAEIQKIGVNINQIAKRVNATSSVYQEDMEEIKGGFSTFFGDIASSSSMVSSRALYRLMIKLRVLDPIRKRSITDLVGHLFRRI